MKKILSLLTVISMVILLVSCTPVPDVFIYKYYETQDFRDNLLELYNPTEQEIDLSNYSIDLIRNNDVSDVANMKLEGTLKPKEFYLIGNPQNQNPEILSKFNASFEDLKFNGDDPIYLKKNGKVIDVLGAYGNNNAETVGENITLIKFPDRFYPTTNFSFKNYIGFVPKFYDGLGRLVTEVTREDIEKGPKFDKESLKEKFFTTNSNNAPIGQGGSLEVKVAIHHDGDTTTFNVLNNKLDEKNIRVRYYLIDTRESTSQGGYQPWGKWATLTTEKILDTVSAQGRPLYVQTAKDQAYKGGFGRVLGLVWADDILVNWALVRDGLTEAKTNHNYTGSYRNVLINYYLKYAEQSAIDEELKIHNKNQKDKSFDYKLGKFKKDYKKYINVDIEKYVDLSDPRK